MSKKNSVQELIVKAAQSLKDYNSNLRTRITTAVSKFYGNTGRNPRAIHLNREQIEELELIAGMSLDTNSTVFGIPIVKSDHFAVV